MKVHGDSLTIELEGAQVTIPAPTIAELWIERIRAEALRPQIFAATSLVAELPPAIGASWKGGIYAGVARGGTEIFVDRVSERHPDYYLIVMDQAADELKWDSARKWAQELGPEYHLPTRRELALCYANVPELFERTWYWSGEQYAGGESYAWYQTFDNGSQNDTHKANELRARAVRRLTI